MELILLLVIGFFLGAMSLLDIYNKSVPSIFPTTIILLLAVVNFQYINFGIVALVFAWLLYEFDFIKGMADLKAIVIVGMMLTTMNSFYIMIILIMVFGMFYQLLFLKVLKKKADEEIPFVPVFLCVYIALALAGLI